MHGDFHCNQILVHEDRVAVIDFDLYEILVPWRVDRRRLWWLMATLLVNRQTLKAVKKPSAGGPEPVTEMRMAVSRIGQGRDSE